MFTGYRDGYLQSYGPAYDAARRIDEHEINKKLRKTLPQSSSNAQDRFFEQGWNDGYSSKTRPTWRMSETDKKVYQRGHAMGQRHREYDRGDQLRKARQHQNSQNLQEKSR